MSSDLPPEEFERDVEIERRARRVLFEDRQARHKQQLDSRKPRDFPTIPIPETRSKKFEVIRNLFSAFPGKNILPITRLEYAMRAYYDMTLDQTSNGFSEAIFPANKRPDQTYWGIKTRLDEIIENLQQEEQEPL